MRRDPLLKGRSRRELDDLFLASHAVSESQDARGWSVSRAGAGSHAGGTAATAVVSRLPDVNPDLVAARLPEVICSWPGQVHCCGRGCRRADPAGLVCAGPAASFATWFPYG